MISPIRVGRSRPKEVADLRASDYQKPSPDGTGHCGALLSVSADDASGRCVLVLGVGGCSGEV